MNLKYRVHKPFPNELTWFKSTDGHIVGIDLSLSPRAIADCLSAEYPIPLETSAIVVVCSDSPLHLHVGDFVFTETVEPKYPVQHCIIN